MEIDMTVRSDVPEPHLQAAVERGARASTAAPGRSAPHTKAALAYFMRVQALGHRHQDSQRWIALQLEAATQAERLDPHDFGACEMEGLAHVMASVAPNRAPVEVRRSLEAAARTLRRCLTIDPRHPWGLNDLGVVYYRLAESAVDVGEDPSGPAHEALALFEQSSAIDDSYVYPLMNAIDSYNVQAYWRVLRGQDPRDLLPPMERIAARCRRTSPANPFCDGNAAELWMSIAEYLALAGLPRDQAVRESRRLIESSLRVNPDASEQFGTLSRLEVLDAEAARAAGQDARPALERATRVLRSCALLTPDDAVCTREDARRAVLEAEGASGVHRYDEALRLAMRAARNDHGDASGQQVLAEVHLRRARLPGAPRRQRDDDLTEGLAACSAALAINPNHPLTLATQGALLLEQARSAPVGEQPALADRAAHAVARAVELNPLLVRRYGSLRNEARRVVEAPTRP
jgi:tetratricopeptide (TPR) repeat protein